MFWAKPTSGGLTHLHLQRLSWRAIGKLAPCRRKETFGQRPLPAQVARKRQTHLGAQSVIAQALLSALGWDYTSINDFLSNLFMITAAHFLCTTQTTRVLRMRTYYPVLH